MIIEYSKKGERLQTSQNCSDLDMKVSESENRITVTVTAKSDLTLIRAKKGYGFKVDKKGLHFLNGYQSWTDTKEFYSAEKEKDVYKIPKFLLNAYSFDRYGDATFYEYKKGILHGYDFFWSKGKTDRFIFNVNRCAYLVIELNKKENELNVISDVRGKELKAGESFDIFDYYYFEDYEAGRKAFELRYPEKKVKKLLGYTSWYNYYQDINAEIIERDLDSLDGRFDLFQIDDGY